MTTSEAGMNDECKDCGGKLVRLNPPVEDYLEHKFCIKIFSWKLMLLKDDIVLGCTQCLYDEKESNDRDNFNEGVNEIIAEHIRKGDFIEPR